MTQPLPQTLSDAQIRALSKLTFEFQDTRKLHSSRDTYFRMMWGKHFKEGTLKEPLCEARITKWVYHRLFPIREFRLTKAGKEFLKTADTSKFATSY